MLTPWWFARRFVLAWCILAAFGACDRSRDPDRRTDTTLPPSVGAVESLPPGDQAQRWESATGAILLVRDDTVTRAIYPTLTQLDSTAVLDEDVVRGFIAEAVSPEGAAGSLRIRGFSATEEECAACRS